MGVCMAMIAIEQDKLDKAIAEAATATDAGKRRLFGLLPSKPVGNKFTVIDQLIEDELESESDDVDDLDKSWDVIRHFLLNGTKDKVNAELAHLAVTGETELAGGPMDGCAYVHKDRVKAVSDAINIRTEKSLEEYLSNVPDTVYMAEVINDGADYFTDNFQRLKQFYQRAADQNKAVVMVAC